MAVDYPVILEFRVKLTIGFVISKKVVFKLSKNDIKNIRKLTGNSLSEEIIVAALKAFAKANS